LIIPGDESSTLVTQYENLKTVDALDNTGSQLLPPRDAIEGNEPKKRTVIEKKKSDIHSETATTDGGKKKGSQASVKPGGSENVSYLGTETKEAVDDKEELPNKDSYSKIPLDKID
jgi:hypothetical protein